MSYSYPDDDEESVELKDWEDLEFDGDYGEILDYDISKDGSTGYIETTKAKMSWNYDLTLQCCETAYSQINDKLYLGQKITSIEITKNSPKIKLAINGDGLCIVTFINDHNGYYSHELLFTINENEYQYYI